VTTPRIEVDLSKVRHNARQLVERLASRGVSVVGVTKAVCGQPDIARAMLDGGVAALGDARVSNAERMRAHGITAPILLIRTPMLGQVDRIVRTCFASLNADLDVVEALARAACRAGRVHRVIPMVEMGDGREGMPPAALPGFARRVMGLRGVTLAGIGANFACLGGRAPDRATLSAFSHLVGRTERDCGVALRVISGGNSASLAGLLAGGAQTRVNQLRLGEAILLGRDPLTLRRIEGLHTGAFTLVAEIIESGSGGAVATLRAGAGDSLSLLALGDQDTDIGGLSMPGRFTLAGSTSDHLLLRRPGPALAAGTEVRFGLNYSALMRAMSAPDIATILCDVPRAERGPVQRHRHLDPLPG